MVRKSSATKTVLCAFGVWLAPTTASAVDVSFKFEPGIAVPLTTPQSQIYDPGGALSFKALFGLTPYLDIGPTISVIELPAQMSDVESGVAWGFGGGVRLKRPHDAVTLYGISPWVDVDFFYVRTGELDRPGFDAAVGVSFPIGEERTFWLGPFIRYEQVIQIDRAGFNNADSTNLIFGLSFEAGTGIGRKASLPERVVTKEVCPDRDGDGVPDMVDRCPDVKGTVENWGCPQYRKIIVHPDKLELKEKIQFAWDSPALEAASFPLLDEVAQVLKDNKGFHVEIEGHASSEGGDEHNQTLSEQRATAVLDYIVAHGVEKERLVSKGFSSSVPLDTNRTPAGRETNRRVEFDLTIMRSGSSK